jgi:hypothetical protein
MVGPVVAAVRGVSVKNRRREMRWGSMIGE